MARTRRVAPKTPGGGRCHGAFRPLVRPKRCPEGAVLVGRGEAAGSVFGVRADIAASSRPRTDDRATPR